MYITNQKAGRWKRKKLERLYNSILYPHKEYYHFCLAYFRKMWDNTWLSKWKSKAIGNIELYLW